MLWLGRSGLRRGEKDPLMADSGTRCCFWLPRCGLVSCSLSGLSPGNSKSAGLLVPEKTTFVYRSLVLASAV